MRESLISKFYQLAPSERYQKLVERGFLTEQTHQDIITGKKELPREIGNAMVENYLFNYQLPEGVALNFLIDDRDYVVPMVVEEPSVIAAASNAAKLVRTNGGFKTSVSARRMPGQIIFENVQDPEGLKHLLEAHQSQLFEAAITAHPSIFSRGGGLKKISYRLLSNNQQIFLILEAKIDVQAAMGANIVNTILEGMSRYIETLTDETILMSILSNSATDCLAVATCELPFSVLETATTTGAVVAQKIASASQIAQLDSHRAVTHNKGIMNGIDAVVLATGNDWRSVEAAAHAYAALDGHYRGLSKWKISEHETLVGELTIPLPLGYVGGSIAIVPLVQVNRELLGVNSIEELAAVVVATGLAQNLAALRALVTDGIQKGHMALQAKSLALAVGATTTEVSKVVGRLQDDGVQLNQEQARNILAQLRAELGAKKKFKK